MRYLKRFSFLILIFIITSNIRANSSYSTTDEGDPKTGFGLKIYGGPYFSMVFTDDKYFGDSSLSTTLFGSAGVGLVLDFPLGRKSRLMIEPELLMIRLERPLIMFNLTFSTFLSKSFFINYGGSVALDNFSYGGVGPSLGFGLKAGRRNSFFIQGKVLYQKLPGSMDQVTYTGLRAPVTIGWRLDFAPTTRKTVTKVITNYPPPRQNTTKPAPAPEVIRPEQPVRKDTLNVPVPQIETEKPVVPIQPAISADDFLNKPIGDLKTYKYGELTLLLDKVVKEENYLMAEEIQKEIEARENKADMNEIPADRLNQLLKIAIDKEDYVRAALIQEEINRRK